MAYEDRILRMVRQPRVARQAYGTARDSYVARRGRNIGQGLKAGLQGRGLGSFENQMMMDQLRGPTGMNLANQPPKRNFGDLLKQFRGDDEEPKMIPIPTDLGGAQGEFIGDTGYFNEPYFEMGSGIEYQAPSGGTRYTGVPFGDADYNLGRVYPDPNEVNRPVEKRQFDTLPSTLGPFGDARDVNPNISVDYGEESGFTMPGDPVYGKQLDAFNDYVLNDPRQEPLDDYATPPPAQPSSNIINALRNLFGYSRGGIASLKI